jgi:protein regulator of cytokinesis 1
MDQQKRFGEELGNVIDTLRGIFDEIGLARYECENREANVYAAISAALHDQLRAVSQFVPNGTARAPQN